MLMATDNTTDKDGWRADVMGKQRLFVVIGLSSAVLSVGYP